MRCSSLTSTWQRLVGDALGGVHRRVPGLHFAFDRNRDLMASFKPEDVSMEAITEAIQTQWQTQARPPLTLLPAP